MQKQKFRKYLYLFLILLVVLLAVFLIYRNYVSADDLIGSKTKEYWISLSGNQYRVTVSLNNKKGAVKLYKSIVSSCSADLIGFDQEANISGVNQLSGGGTLIEVSGSAGAHAENRQYFIVGNDLCPKYAAFVKNGQVDYNIYSDEPNFRFQDFNADGYPDLSADWRDYDTDPLVNGFRDMYYWQPGSQQFIFDHREGFKY